MIYIFTKFLLKQFFSESRNIKIKTSNHFLRYLNVTENIKDYRRWWLIYYIDNPPPPKKKNHRKHIPYTPHLLKICAFYQDEKCKNGILSYLMRKKRTSELLSGCKKLFTCTYGGQVNSLKMHREPIQADWPYLLNI